jgi:hypothetical protein
MLRIIFLLLITSASFGQVLQETNGSRADNRNVFKLGFRLPQVCWVTGNPNLLNYSAFMSKGAMVYDTCAGKIKRWSGSAWISVADSMATGDTTGLGALYIRNTTTHENKRFSVQSGRLDSILAPSSAGLSLYSNSGTQVGLFGAGGGAGATFYGGVNIDGTTRLNTGLTGVLIGTSGTVSATPNKMVSTFDKNATRDSAILTLADGTRLAVRDSVGGGPTGSGASGRATFWTGASTLSSDAAFLWDNTNKRLSVGITGTTLSQIMAESSTSYAFVATRSTLATSESGFFAANDQSFSTALGSFTVYGSNYSAAQSHLRNQVAFGSRQGLLFLSDNTTSTGGTSPIDFYPGGSSQSQRFIRLKSFGMAMNSAGTTADPVASAILDMNSTTKGVLPPRQTTAQRNAIASPASGLEVTNTSLQNHPNFYNGTAWLGTNQQVGNEAITGNKTIAATTGTHLHMIDATSGNVTITLPTMAAGYVGVEYQFIRTDGSANTVTIQRAGSNTINNAATSFTIAQFERAYVIGVNNSNTFSWHAGKFTNY